MKVIRVHQAIVGPDYVRPNKYTGPGCRLQSCTLYNIGTRHLDFTDIRINEGMSIPFILSKEITIKELQITLYCEAAIWKDDEPERQKLRHDSRAGFTRAHILIWPNQETAALLKHKVKFVDPALIGDGLLNVPLEPIDIIYDKEDITIQLDIKGISELLEQLQAVLNKLKNKINGA
jgi:hypothetical protein